ncbi:MAG: dihydroorotate dehydrogenase electron transfer subunit [Deltaproteobacteria bacterium]|nr:dihydroorotate dehydrogenase electron transfer subunit [Deltaproteobacteria bacterium]
MQSSQAAILHNKKVVDDYFRMRLSWSGMEVRPGQFIMLRVSDGLDPLLRRPFGIYNVIGAKKTTGFSFKRPTGVEILYRVVGKGTAILSSKEPGERINVLGPLGNGWVEPEEARNVIMVAGGVGLAPMLPLAQRLKAGALLFGARHKADTKIVAGFSGLGCKIKIATDDGSRGFKGFVTGLLAKEIKPDSVIYACGPAPMLKAVAVIALASGARCFVSLERTMACGIGVCLGCAVKTGAHKAGYEADGFSMVCSDGPVFDSTDIDWDAL